MAVSSGHWQRRYTDMGEIEIGSPSGQETSVVKLTSGRAVPDLQAVGDGVGSGWRVEYAGVCRHRHGPFHHLPPAPVTVKSLSTAVTQGEKQRKGCLLI